MAHDILSAERLRELLHYDPETGVFTWLKYRARGARAGESAVSKNDHGYILIGIDQQVFRAHRLAFLWMTGSWPRYQVDHINGVPDDNRFANLRDATPAVNTQNQRKARSDSTLGILGVHRVGNKYKAQISVGGRRAYLGYYATAEAAHGAYVEAKRRIHPGNTL